MAKKALIILALIALLLSLVPAAAACLGGGGGANDAIDVMKKVPKDAGEFAYIDIKALRDDEDFSELYEDMEDAFAEFTESFLGIDFDDVDSFGVFGEEFWLEGNFDLDEVRDNLENPEFGFGFGSSFEEGEYKGVEIWESPGTWLALMGDTIIFGNEDGVKAFIRVVEEGDDSLYEDEDFRDLVDRLPGGPVVTVDEGAFYDAYEYDGLQVWGMSLKKKDSDTVTMTMVCKFEDEDSADSALDDIENDVESDEENELRNVRVTRDGRFVEVTAEADIEDMVDIADDGGDDGTADGSGDVEDVAIMSHSSYSGEYGDYHVVGEVKNNGSENLTWVELTATFYDSSDSVLDFDYGYTDIEVLTPVQKSPFEIHVWDETISAQVDHYTIVVSDCDVATAEPYREFEILSHASSIDSWGYYKIVGEVQNTGSRDAESVDVVGTFYDSSGTVVATRTGYISQDILAAGDVAPFDIWIWDETQAALIDSYNLQVQCYDDMLA